MSNPIGPPLGIGKTTKQWLQEQWPDVYNALVAKAEHKYAGIRNYRDAKWARKRPPQSGKPQ